MDCGILILKIYHIFDHTVLGAHTSIRGAPFPHYLVHLMLLCNSVQALLSLSKTLLANNLVIALIP